MLCGIDFESGFSVVGMGWDPFFTHVGLEGDELMFGRTLNGKEYVELKKIHDISLETDGFYTVPIFGDKCIILAGGNYLFFHDLSDPRYSMFRADKNYFEFYNRTTDYSEPFSGISGERSQAVERIIVPDVLVENIAGTSVSYSTDDMLRYYARYLDSNVVANPNAKPWATGKDPAGMIIEVEFKMPYSKYAGRIKNKSDHLVILNGYVNPLKRHLFRENRRVKTLKISSLDETEPFEMLVSFDDAAEFKRIAFPAKVNKVALTILEYYEGSKYKDLCIQMIGTDFDMDSGVSFIRQYKERAFLLPR
jgi:hypothetical protein